MCEKAQLSNHLLFEQMCCPSVCPAIYEGTKKVTKVCADINAPRFDYLKLIGEGAVLSDVPLKTKKHYFIQVDGAETCGMLKATTTYNGAE